MTSSELRNNIILKPKKINPIILLLIWIGASIIALKFSKIVERVLNITKKKSFFKN